MRLRKLRVELRMVRELPLCQHLLRGTRKLILSTVPGWICNARDVSKILYLGRNLVYQGISAFTQPRRHEDELNSYPTPVEVSNHNYHSPYNLHPSSLLPCTRTRKAGGKGPISRLEVVKLTLICCGFALAIWTEIHLVGQLRYCSEIMHRAKRFRVYTDNIDGWFSTNTNKMGPCHVCT